MKAITTTFHGPTDFKGSRIIAKDSNENRVILSYDHKQNSWGNHANAAITLCKKLRWGGTLYGGHVKKSMVWVFQDKFSMITIREQKEGVDHDH
jgi:hypothetical protein